MSLNIAKKREKLIPLIDLDHAKCVNCLACIHVCPVKYCNNGTGDTVEVDHDLCIGCGACIARCTHNARGYLDDMEAFIHHGVIAGKKSVAVVAPAVVSSFGEDYMRFNGWLREMCGVEAVFEGSFGAELAVKSYVDYINTKHPKCVIAQPCPAIVSYIELYLPDLLPYLAPVDSPLVHTMKMIREYFPQYDDCQIAVFTPCLAKKREFVATQLGDYNVSFKSVQKYLDTNKLSLKSFPVVEYINPSPERAVLFPTPGGLLRTLERWIPDIREKSRKIEGPTMYDYLASLSQSIQDGTAPLVVDCLNCELGCNGGPLSNACSVANLDQAEAKVEKRRENLTTGYKNQVPSGNIEDYQAFMDSVLSSFWKENLYTRQYSNRSSNNKLEVPAPHELRRIFEKMGKTTESERKFDCNSCGYGNCENMATAIHNNLNRPENCLHFKGKAQDEQEDLLRDTLANTTIAFCIVDSEMSILFVNEALCQLFGTKKDRLMGTTLFKAQFEASLAGERPVAEFRVKRPDGSSTTCLFNASSYTQNTPVGEKKGYIAMITDLGK